MADTSPDRFDGANVGWAAPYQSIEPPQLDRFEFGGSPSGVITTVLQAPAQWLRVEPDNIHSSTATNEVAARKKRKMPSTNRKFTQFLNGIRKSYLPRVESTREARPSDQFAEYVNSNDVPLNHVVYEMEQNPYDGDDTGLQDQISVVPPLQQRIPSFSPDIDPNDLLSPLHDAPETKTPIMGLTTPIPAPSTSSLQVTSTHPHPSPQESRYDVTKPTCSLNVVCYRSGAQGCELHQLQTILESRFKNHDAFIKACANNSNLIATDRDLFEELRRLYNEDMCGFWRRHFSLKTLRGLRVLSYSPANRPSVVPFDEFILQEMLYAYTYPSKVTTNSSWIEWVFRLRRQERRHALELVEGWNSTRIIIAGTIPWAASCIFGITWAVVAKDIQAAFTMASFILTGATIMLALLAVISSIESPGKARF